ncbi:MAG: hypothetical protein LBE81_05550 [Azonexus sp.]|jgi:hypothetical protein|uniref:hypothetical protein n=1 Tax=Azonexus sp. TaxID=1872668 RepID=UPI00282F897A|nr:hypothetical protein [Azonexus sp.]MDR0776086.1 hypothetical protein [Azonexus sp.]
MNTLERIVDDYIRDHQRNAEREQRWFAIQPDLSKAIEVAALAKSPSGKRLSHQWRIPERALRESNRRLQTKAAKLEASRSFEDLYEVVAATIQSISGIGELTIYDTALRIGAFLRLEPAKVFLHAGTRSGARALGLRTSAAFLEMSSIPSVLQVFKPSEVEDVLCIYKHRFNGTNRS